MRSPIKVHGQPCSSSRELGVLRPVEHALTSGRPGGPDKVGYAAVLSSLLEVDRQVAAFMTN